MRNVTHSHTVHASRFFLKRKAQTDKQNMVPGDLNVVTCLYGDVHVFSSLVLELRCEVDLNPLTLIGMNKHCFHYHIRC